MVMYQHYYVWREIFCFVNINHTVVQRPRYSGYIFPPQHANGPTTQEEQRRNKNSVGISVHVSGK